MARVAPLPVRRDDRAPVADPVVAMAMAWHREGCALRQLSSRACRYWPMHLRSAERVVADLDAMRVVVEARP